MIFFLFSLQILSETLLVRRKNERDMIINVYWYSRKVPVILVICYGNFSVFNRSSKNTSISSSIKVLPVGAELFYVDGQTDRYDDDNSRFSQFCENTEIQRPNFVTWQSVYRLIQSSEQEKKYYKFSRISE